MYEERLKQRRLLSAQEDNSEDNNPRSDSRV